MFTVSVVTRPVNTIVVDQGATVTDCSESCATDNQTEYRVDAGCSNLWWLPFQLN